MGTRALIGYLDTDGGAKLTSTYNHYDGYPSNLGKGLENFYDNDAKAEEIANVGYISYLDPETGEWEAANKQKPEMTTLPDNFNEAMMEIAAEVDSFGADYGYIWDNENEEWITVKNNGIGAMTDNLEMELAHLKGKFAMLPNQPDQTMNENEGTTVKILDRQADLDQAYFNLDVDGKEMSFTYWDYAEEFDNATYEEIMDMIEKQLINTDKYGFPVDPQLTPEQKEEIAQVVLKDLQTNPGWKSRLSGYGDLEENRNMNVIDKAKEALKGKMNLDVYIKSLENDIRLNGEKSYEDYSLDDFVEDYDNYIQDKTELDEAFVRQMKYKAGIIK
jgi:hypothetical protein